MSLSILEPYFSHPLEREFEAWVTSEIIKYFEELKIEAEIWAVSPKDEKSWPADETLCKEGKIVGLQFKRPLLDSKSISSLSDLYVYSRLYWNLSKPKTQLTMIQSCKEIFYALPTFINRNWQKRALDHCLFWRPDNNTKSTRVWYNNKNPRTKTNVFESGCVYSWGTFIERIMECKEGQLISEVKTGQKYKTMSNYLNRLKTELTNNNNENINNLRNGISEIVNNDILFLLFIPEKVLNKDKKDKKD